MKRKKIFTIFIIILIGFIIYAVGYFGYKNYINYQKANTRQQLFSELKPVKLKNCTFKRFGDAHDGGYLLCANLMHDVTSAYSYGIDGRDKWGCDISKMYNVNVHQYDCFNTTRPACTNGKFIFHEECVGDKYSKQDNKIFDSIKNQIIKNSDQNKKLVMKIDVEGAEWDSFLATPDEVLNNIEQLIVEFHWVDQKKYIHVIQKLKKTFYPVNVHFNNHVCYNKITPFTTFAYEVLFVNKRIGIIDNIQPDHPAPNPLDAPNNPQKKDCQVSW